MTPRVKVAAKVVVTFVILFVLLNFMMIKLNLRRVVFDSFLFDEEYRHVTILFPVVLSIVTSYIGYVLAQKKNRSRKNWAVLCFFLNIWGLIVLIFLPSQEKPRISAGEFTQ